jgi:PAS domain S-box-containing protein
MQFDRGSASNRHSQGIDLFAGNSELSRLMREHDWSATALGPVEGWPQSLRIVVRILLDSRYAMWLGWGPEFTFFYNDAYARMTLGAKHPWALGRSAREVWAEIWDDIGPRAESVVRTGKATWDERLLLFLERRGFPEETYHTFSYSPAPDDDGGVGGMLCVVTEDTERAIGERRLKTLRELAARTTEEAKSAEEACRAAVRTLEANPHDLPFALLYLTDADARIARLAGATGLLPGSLAAPASYELTSPSRQGAAWPLRNVLETGLAETLTNIAGWLGPLPIGVYPEPPHTATVLPIKKAGQDGLAGFVVAGVSPRRPFDDDYRGFLDLLAGQIASAVANARAYAEEKHRAEALAELDRAKTAFFSNVSHEFRTPLTLILGPIEELLASSGDAARPENLKLLEVAHRNGLRLQKLVNTLLDFSRIEAGRVQASYEPTDLASFTAELTSNFRSACEKAGLELTVNCPPLPEPVHVDQEMWEKIVFNLLSNAFKFTLQGRIEVALRLSGSVVELTVIDTGTGIPPDQIAHLFERFHRVEGAKGRTQEGSGIGLALVRELVRLHGGDVRVESRVGKGSTFIVTVPVGAAHLPPERIRPARASVSTALGATAYIEEALRWLPDSTDSLGSARWETGDVDASRSSPTATPPRILLADDNADMREYVRRLLAGRYEVTAVADGLAALRAAREKTPDLVLSDVMMPQLDGFGLLAELRADPATAEVPVLLLSAKAGEEARVEGLQAGADDYLTKPFGARELLARVRAHLELAKLRRQAAAAVRASEQKFRTLSSHAPVGIFQTDAAGHCLYVNERWCELAGLAPREALGEGWIKALHPEDRERVLREWHATAAEGRQFASEFRFCTSQGKISWLQGTAVALRNNSGEITGFIGTTTEFTERKQAEEAFAESEQRFRQLAENINEVFWLSDPEKTRMLYVSPACEEVWGLSRQSIYEQPGSFVDAIHPDDRQQALSGSFERQRRGESADVQYRVVRPDRTVRWIRDRSFPIKDASGRVYRLAGIAEDITERKRAEEEIREKSAILRSFYDTAPMMMGVVEVLKDDILHLTDNAATAKFFGRGPDALDRQFASQMGVPSEALREWVRHYWESERTRVPVRFEYPHQTPQGTRWLSAIVCCTEKLAEGRIRCCYVAEDVTERKQVEHDLRESLALLGTLQSNSPVGFAFVDREFRFVRINESLAAISGMSPAEHLGRTVLEAAPALWRQLEEGMRGVLLSGQPVVNQELAGESAATPGTRHWLLNHYPVQVRGEIVGIGTLMTDITERKHLEEELRRRAKQLQDADRRKDEFLAMLAHELRNPLAPVRNALQILKMPGMTGEAVRQAREIMERQVYHLVRLVDDLLDVSRIMQNKIELRKEPVDLAIVFDRAVETAQPAIDAKAQELAVSQPTHSIRIQGDLVRLAQVVSNLLVNAAKYTDKGGKILLTGERDGRDAVIRVRDTGMGIDSELLPRIFDLFTQADRSLARSEGGLGIGLTVVKHLVEMHGGSVSATSDGPGQGSEFVVRLPAHSPSPIGDAATVGTDEIRPRGTSRKVLVVDDNMDAAESTAMLLRMLGHSVETAHDGHSALQAARTFHPEVVLLDIGLPGMSGYEVAKALRAEFGLERHLLVALTGYGQEEDRRKSDASGFDRHLVKPVDPGTLIALLDSLDQPNSKPKES